MANSADVLAALLEERLQPDADHLEIDRRIEARFGEKWCVVFTDMAGFSWRSAHGGIIPFLTLIHRLDQIALPIIESNAGLLLKKIADSHLLLFRDPAMALKACVELQQALYRYNRQAPEPEQILLGCGIGFGNVLKLGDEDVFGVEVNLAARLGEDLSGPWDIFLTAEAARAIGTSPHAELHRVADGRFGDSAMPFFEAKYAIAGQEAGQRQPLLRKQKAGTAAAS